MIPLAGYTDRLSLRPGETIKFHLSNATGAKVSAEVVRVRSADANPKGPGIRTEPVAKLAAADVGAHPVRLGSYGRADLGAHLMGLESFTLVATIWPTRIGHSDQPILSWLDPAMATGVMLAIGADKQLTATVGQGANRLAYVVSPAKIVERQWLRVWCSYEAATRKMTVASLPLGAAAASLHSATLDAAMARPARGDIAIAAGPHGSFNGKLERPMIFSRPLTAAEVLRAAMGASVDGLVAGWDFGKEIPRSRIVDIGPNALHGELVQRPTRAMTGASWNGREMCWRHAPEQYGAIHFHDDDIDDCGWPAAFSWTAPTDLPSGNYALLLSANGETENLPFFVVPPKGKTTAKIAVLVSTYTYTIYGNFARPEWMTNPKWAAEWQAQARSWKAYPHNPGAHVGYGLSTYNFHNDGSGIAYASWRRPMLNLRIGYITYPNEAIRGSGLRHYPADLHLCAWLDAKGYAYDIITDVELDAEGAALLKPYTALLTGTHPEYHTPAMLDAIEGYRDGGGRLLYLGGNGFYWKIALDHEKTGVVEIRRGEGGIRAWAAETGEYYNAFDGEYGGLWRRNGRPPQKIAGVGFTAQGNFVGSFYRVKPDARSSRASWIIEGLKGDIIGNFGLSGHGAAGFELDRAEKRLGTPAHAVVLAASEGHKPDAPWVLVPEEQLSHIVTWAGEPAEKLIRADMTFFETPNNGAVFSVGSITFCGSLPVNGYDNDVSSLLKRVLDRFADPTARFEMPTG
jgi:N,N-dimethylformamidase